jgi:hypothetical protein
MKRIVSTCLLVSICFNSININSINAKELLQLSNISEVTQDPRTCGDPRTQFPSNPPC